MFSDHSGLKPETNDQKITGKASNAWKLNDTLLNSQWVKEEVSGESEKYTEMNKNENTKYRKVVGYS